MVERLSDTALEGVSQFVNERMALHFPKNRWRDLERGLRGAANQIGLSGAEEMVDRVFSNNLTQRHMDVLASHLTVGETYFFRDRKLFAALENQILPELIRERRGKSQALRIWSAGCCTGEEAYSVAIVLKRLLPDIENWNITLLATDINPSFLHAAGAGEYSQWSFRDIPSWVRRHFHPTGRNRYQIDPSIKTLVKFAYLNLAEDVYPSLTNHTNAMDVILCRNVLMYFSSQQVDKVVRNLAAALAPNGYLVVAPTETLLLASPDLSRVQVSGAIVFRKNPSSMSNFKEETNAPLITIPALVAEKPQQPPAVPKQNSDPSSLYSEAVDLHNAGNHGEAAEKLFAIISGDSHHSEAAALLSRVFADAGKLGSALRWADVSLVRGKLKADLHYLRATILQEQGAIEESEQALRRALYLDPRFVLAYFALGNLALQRERMDEAEKCFLNTLSLLEGIPTDEVLPASDGMTAGRLREITQATLEQKEPA